MRSTLPPALLTWLSLYGVALPAPALAQVRRLAVLVVPTPAAAQREAAPYAAALGRVLRELAGAHGGDNLLLQGPSATTLERALREAGERARQARRRGERSQLVLYIAGRGDRSGLRLRDGPLPYGTLQGWLATLPVDERVVLLDLQSDARGAGRAALASAAAALGRGTGATFVAGAVHVSGPSSTALFTHYLVSGLRGAADTNGDGLVSLGEAFRYARDGALHGAGGAQRPGARLFGDPRADDLPLSDLALAPATLELDPTLHGTLFVRDVDGRLLAEVRKRPGVPLRLGFGTGRYLLSLDQAGTRLHTDVALTAGAPVRVGRADFARWRGPLPRAPRDEPAARVVPVGMALVPRLGNYGARGGRGVKSYLGLHGLYGQTEVLKGVQIALGGNRATSRAKGLQVAGIANRAGSVRGVQLAGAGNSASGRLSGLQVSGVGNLVRGTVYGAQVALGYSGARTLEGLQLAAVNVAQRSSRGIVVGILNLGRRQTGAEIGVVNWASELRGLQVAGVNTARNVRGLQLGLINVATGDVQGAQIGLLNYADSADVGIAPLSITRAGGVHAQLSSGAAALLEAALRLEARYTYSFVSAALHPLGPRARRAYQLGAGFGLGLPLRQGLRAELDASLHTVQPLGAWLAIGANLLTRLRLLVRLALRARLDLVFGPSFSVLAQRDERHRLRPGFLPRVFRASASATTGQVRVLYWPGWVIGVRL